MSFEIIRNRDRRLLNERPTFDEALDVARREHVRPGSEVVISDPSGKTAAIVWHDYVEVFDEYGDATVVSTTRSIDDPAVSPQARFYGRLLGLRETTDVRVVR